jgi:hypothetical protein
VAAVDGGFSPGEFAFKVGVQIDHNRYNDGPNIFGYNGFVGFFQNNAP